MRPVTGWCWGGALMVLCMLGETSATRSGSQSKKSLRETAGGFKVWRFVPLIIHCTKVTLLCVVAKIFYVWISG